MPSSAQFSLLLRALEIAKNRDEYICLSVCLFVCPLAYHENSAAELLTKFLCTLPVTVARSYGGIAIRYVLPVLFDSL